jgi:hypothetical protein
LGEWGKAGCGEDDHRVKPRIDDERVGSKRVKLLPSIPDSRETKGTPGGVGVAELEAVKYRQTDVYRPEPPYPGCETTLAVSYLFKEKTRVPFVVWWQISSEGGLSPDTGGMGKVTVAV